MSEGWQFNPNLIRARPNQPFGYWYVLEVGLGYGYGGGPPIHTQPIAIPKDDYDSKFDCFERHDEWWQQNHACNLSRWWFRWYLTRSWFYALESQSSAKQCEEAIESKYVFRKKFVTRMQALVPHFGTEYLVTEQPNRADFWLQSNHKHSSTSHIGECIVLNTIYKAHQNY